MNGYPVVTASEMKRLEKLAFDRGESEEEYMLKAGEGIAHVLEEYLVTPRGSPTIYLLIGKGNNGGDAFVAGTILKQKGFSVTACHLHPLEECSQLSQKMSHRYKAARGELKYVQSVPSFDKGILVDGLVGTGFSGKAEGLLADVIDAANASNLPIFAIDIPSGLNGETGEVKTVAIKADTTIYLGLPKMGFFLDSGWNHVGKLRRVDFGLLQECVDDATAKAYLINHEKAKKAMPPLVRDRHKYDAGYVIAVAGSREMPGAAMLAGLAAFKTGAGIVRLFYPEGMSEELSSAPYELIKEGWDLKDDSRILEEAQRANALIVGPGCGRSDEMGEAIKTLLAKASLPTVLDADALFFLAKYKKMSLPPKTIITPHRKEMERILEMPPTMEACQAYVKEREVTLVLKGAPTMIFHHHTKPLIIPHGDPGMATAGTGDVLTGMIAALLAQGLSRRDAASLGVYLHALAGELAAREETSYSVMATDLIHYISEVIKEKFL